MVTIDRLDISHYFQYARRVSSVETTYKTFRLEQAHAIPAHTRVVDVRPKFEEVEVLFGFRKSTQPWACFCAPSNYFSHRRNSFAFDRVCPTLGDLEAQLELLKKVKNSLEKEDGDDSDHRDYDEDDNLEAGKKRSKKPLKMFKKSEKKRVTHCLEEVDKLNRMINFIMSRVGQFLQA
jgi:hypothetical protein